MTFINYASREINCKIVYYGPGLCGKTTNLQYIYDSTAPQAKGKLISLAKANEPCGLLASGLTLCGGGATCPITTSGICLPPAEDGGLCDPSQNLECLAPATCVDGYCRFQLPSACPVE